MPAAEETERFCRRCNAMQPIENYMRGQRRFCCRRHFYAMQHSSSRARCRKKGGRSESEVRAIQYARKLAKNMFAGYDLTLTAGDARLALDHDQCIVPLDPSAPLSAANFALCYPPQRQVLIKLWSVQRDAALYTQIVRSFSAATAAAAPALEK
jgi:hypothetical protein